MSVLARKFGFKVHAVVDRKQLDIILKGTDLILEDL